MVAEEKANLHALEPAEVSWIHRIKGMGQAICRHRGWNLHFVGDRTVGFLGEGSFEEASAPSATSRKWHESCCLDMVSSKTHECSLLVY